MDAAPTDSALGLAYAGLRILAVADSSHLLWLEEFLAPHFVRAEGPFDWVVRLANDTERFESALALGPHPSGAEADVFALDSSVVRLPVWRSPRGGRGDVDAAFDAEFGCFYTVDAREVEILAAGRGGRDRVALLRVVRELAMDHAHRVGGIFLHASAVARDGRGVIFTGEKSAGKTTLLTHVLLGGGYRFVTNDRVYLALDATPPSLGGMPTIISIRPPMLDLLPEFRRRLESTTFRPYRTLREIEAAGPVREPYRIRGGKYGCSPAQYCALLGAERDADVEVRAVVFPRISGRPGGITQRELPADEVAARIPASLLCAGDWRKSASFFAGGEVRAAPEGERLAASCHRIARCARGVEWELGLDAYASDDAARLLADLLDPPGL